MSSVPRGEDLLVLQLLHAGGGSHRHGDDDVVDVKGAFSPPPADGLMLYGVEGEQGQSPSIQLLKDFYRLLHHYCSNQSHTTRMRAQF